jgi:hypothetical protein
LLHRKASLAEFIAGTDRMKRQRDDVEVTSPRSRKTNAAVPVPAGNDKYAPNISKKTPDGEAFEFRKGVSKGQREIELVGEGLGDQMERVSNPTIFEELRCFFLYLCVPAGMI